MFTYIKHYSDTIQIFKSAIIFLLLYIHHDIQSRCIFVVILETSSILFAGDRPQTSIVLILCYNGRNRLKKKWKGKNSSSIATNFLLLSRL